MALIIEAMRSVNNYLNKYQDKRTANFPLMSSPFYTLGICLTYVYIVKYLGPKLMENRKPFHLQRVLVIYNSLQVLFSAWLFYRIGMGGWLTGEYSFRCQPVDYTSKPSTLRMVDVSWWYYFSKFTEFFDTIFFVLRKKNDHVSTLHVIHHGIMPMSVWFGVKFTPGGHSTFFGFLNTFVHIIMYTYYMLSAMGPHMQKYLWWKKYLTTFQMVQFVGIMLHAFQLLFTDCDYPRAFVWWIGMHAVVFFFLFKDFYNQSYSRRPPRSQRVSVQNGHVQNGHVTYENGHLPYVSGHLTSGNGYLISENGHLNCVKNGGLTNGDLKNGYIKQRNGYVKENGYATMQNGDCNQNNTTQNGVSAIKQNGELHHRIKQK